MMARQRLCLPALAAALAFGPAARAQSAPPALPAPPPSNDAPPAAGDAAPPVAPAPGVNAPPNPAGAPPPARTSGDPPAAGTQAPAGAGVAAPAGAGAAAPATPTSPAPPGGDLASRAPSPGDPTRPAGDTGFVGFAAPPTRAATTGWALPVRAGLEIFGQYAYRRTTGGGGSSWFHQFDVPRVHAALDGEWQGARGRVVLEAVRSAAEGSLIGVAGDSLVARVREAWGSYRAYGFEAYGGVVPTLTVPELEGTWMLRPVARVVQEEAQLAAPADLGAGLRYVLPRRYGWAAVAAYNGEGYTNRELNRGKNVEAAASIHPLPDGALLPLALFASYQQGSSGTGSARADRATGGLLWQGARVRGGLVYTYAWGLRDDGSRRAAVVSAFARVEPAPRVLLGARADHYLRDTRAEPADDVTTLVATAGYRVAAPLEVFAAGTRSIATSRAEAAEPGAEFLELALISRLVF